MTRVVVLDRELHEAITVVEIPVGIIDQLNADPRHRRRLCIPTESPISFDLSPGPPTMIEKHWVELVFEPVFRDPRRPPLFWYAYPDDPELALQLRAAFLPGQLGEVHRREREAYFRGLFGAITLR